jgi:hypothetical protein
MTRLIAIPIHDDGKAVLIVTAQAGVVLMGFIADSTLGQYFGRRLSIPECMVLVEQHLRSFEQILLRKSNDESYADEALACIEVEIADLASAGISKPH